MITRTSTILPSLIMADNWAFIELESSIKGCLLKLIISDEPYPTPLFVKFRDVMLPLKIGSISHGYFLPWIWSASSLKVTLISG